MVPQGQVGARISSNDTADNNSYIGLKEINEKRWESFFTSDECDRAFTSFKEVYWGVKGISGRRIMEKSVLYRVEWKSSNGRDFVRFVALFLVKCFEKIAY